MKIDRFLSKKPVEKIFRNQTFFFVIDNICGITIFCGYNWKARYQCFRICITERLQMGQRILNEVKNRFDWRNIMYQYVSLYCSL